MYLDGDRDQTYPRPAGKWQLPRQLGCCNKLRAGLNLHFSKTPVLPLIQSDYEKNIQICDKTMQLSTWNLRCHWKKMNIFDFLSLSHKLGEANIRLKSVELSRGFRLPVFLYAFTHHRHTPDVLRTCPVCVCVCYIVIWQERQRNFIQKNKNTINQRIGSDPFLLPIIGLWCIILETMTDKVQLEKHHKKMKVNSWWRC